MFIVAAGAPRGEWELLETLYHHRQIRDIYAPEINVKEDNQWLQLPPATLASRVYILASAVVQTTSVGDHKIYLN